MDALHLAAVCAVVPGLGRAKLPQLLQILGSSENVFYAKYETLVETKLITPARAARFIANRNQDLPQIIDRFCRHNGVHLLTIFDEDYPASLRTIHDSPLVLYVKGYLPKADYSLAVVGSRSATAYGLRAADYFSSALALEKIPIISGGARGIDTAAHKACLAVKGYTVAVLGCGLDKIYPPENKDLFHQICEHGALISEFPPGTLPKPGNFPTRNRIIAGLAQGVLVVEAAKRSGAIITANLAIDEGRDVFCVPGNIFDYTSIGCHELIRTGAKLVDTPQDILCERVSWQMPNIKTDGQLNIFEYAKPSSDDFALASVTNIGKNLLDILRSSSMTMEEIAERSGLNFSVLSIEMLNLQVAGLVDVDQANRYYRR